MVSYFLQASMAAQRASECAAVGSSGRTAETAHLGAPLRIPVPRAHVGALLTHVSSVQPVETVTAITTP